LLRPRTWSATIAACLLALGVYHNYRIHWFVTHVAASEFYLPADAENLRGWLEQFERKHGRFELATASIELNYLSAYWTNADLLLPSGFPYHNVASNREIRERAAAVLKLYGATPQSWKAITRHTHGRFQEAWRRSRIEGTGQSYTYHFYHRLRTLNVPDVSGWVREESNQIANSLVQKPDPSRRASFVSYSGARGCEPCPDVILIDPVSRALGNPKLGNYALAFRSGEIEAWVRRN
jgi:hypothetical protein